MRPKHLVPLVAVLASFATACGDDASDDATDATEAVTTTPSSPATAPSSAATAAPPGGSSTEPADDAAGAGIALATSDLGEIIVDEAGTTLYLFVPDAQGESTCYDECEATWPILPEVDSVGAGLDESLLDTTTRSNGDVQATYNGWPLYYFAGDAAPGDVNGQGINDVWWVVDATGAAVGS
jgi:predicted lipoprotein with Yx(FWY)xxD motif